MFPSLFWAAGELAKLCWQVMRSEDYWSGQTTYRQRPVPLCEGLDQDGRTDSVLSGFETSGGTSEMKDTVHLTVSDDGDCTAFLRTSEFVWHLIVICLVDFRMWSFAAISWRMNFPLLRICSWSSCIVSQSARTCMSLNRDREHEKERHHFTLRRALAN